jgi:hypothetical protein
LYYRGVWQRLLGACEAGAPSRLREPVRAASGRAARMAASGSGSRKQMRAVSGAASGSGVLRGRRSRLHGRRGGQKEHGVPFPIFQRPTVASGSSERRGSLFQGTSPSASLLPFHPCFRSDSSALPPGCLPGLVASFFGAAWLFSPSHFFFSSFSFYAHHSAQTLPRVRALSHFM